MWFDLITYTPMYVTGFWALVLLMSAKHNRTKQFLGIFMILAFGVYFSHALFFQKQYSFYLFFDPVYIFCSLSVYPMYYWYIKLLTVEPEYKSKNLIMFLPALIFAIAMIIDYIFMTPKERLDYLQSTLFLINESNTVSKLVSIQHLVFIASRLVFMIQVFYFLILGRKLVLQYNNRIANFYANQESKSIVWVNLLLYSFFATSVMSIIFNLAGRSLFLNSTFLLLIPSAIFSVLLFFIGFQGYLQNYSIIDLNQDELDNAEFSMKEYNQNQLKDKLLELFDSQQIYKHNDLKITQVSIILQTNRTYVSNLINSEFKCTFSDFVNRYRILEAKKLMSDSMQKNFTLSYVADESGFGSVNTFIRIFKDLEGMTPGRFRDKLHLNGNPTNKND